MKEKRKEKEKIEKRKSVWLRAELSDSGSIKQEAVEAVCYEGMLPLLFSNAFIMDLWKVYFLHKTWMEPPPSTAVRLKVTSPKVSDSGSHYSTPLWSLWALAWKIVAQTQIYACIEISQHSLQVLKSQASLILTWKSHMAKKSPNCESK